MCFVEIIEPHAKFVSLAPQRSAGTLEGSAPSLPHITGHRRSDALHELNTTSPRPFPPTSAFAQGYGGQVVGGEGDDFYRAPSTFNFQLSTKSASPSREPRE